jgi:addiction module HigA family antidote
MSAQFIVKSVVQGELVHPGYFINEYLLAYDISQTELAMQLGVPPRRINEIVLGKRGITADTAVRLEAAWSVSAHYWMSIQADYEIALARERGAASHVDLRRYGRDLGGEPFAYDWREGLTPV